MANAPRRLANLEKLAAKTGGRGADRHRLSRSRRRSCRRCRRDSRVRLHARHSGGAGSDDAAGAGGFGHRRQDRREPESGKNLLGTFHQPLAVLVDPDVLATLPEREYRSGLFEAMKYGVIRNPAIFDLMESNRDALLARDGALLETLIAECIRVKADVVSAR